MNKAFTNIRSVYVRALRGVVVSMLFISGLGVAAMVLINCVDLVRLCSAVTLACAMPYTTAVKGHVAIEYFFHKLGRKSRIAVDSVMRCCSCGLFVFLSVRSFLYGLNLYSMGQVTQTLQVPIFWVAHVISFSCLVVAMVILYNLVNPRREMIKL